MHVVGCTSEMVQLFLIITHFLPYKLDGRFFFKDDCACWIGFLAQVIGYQHIKLKVAGLNTMEFHFFTYP